MTSGLSGGLSGLTGGLSGGLSGLTGGLSGLTGGLSSIGSLAGAFSAISAVKSLFGRKGGVRMPSVAVNTANRAPLTQKILSLLGDPGIPSPTFTGENNRGSSTNARTSQNDARMTALRARLNALQVEDEKLKQEIQALPNNALPGDPKFEEIRNRLLKVITEQQDILKELG